MKERYKRVKMVFLRMTEMSVLFRIIRTGETIWIPLSLIHGGSELYLRTAAAGDELDIDIIEWKVSQIPL